jgi:alcohol dehydrogenase (cytochrome c)
MSKIRTPKAEERWNRLDAPSRHPKFEHPMSRKARLGLGIIAVVIVAVIAAGFAVSPIHWRAKVILQKATGRLPTIEWSDLAWMVGPHPTVFLMNMGDPPNPYQAIENPLKSADDVAAGKHLFEQHCSHCHGSEARGGEGGPSLHERVFRQGRSDWALYWTITHGIPGTAMVGWKLPRDDVWRLVAYVNDTLLKGQSAAASDKPSAAVVAPVSADDILKAEGNTAEWLTYSGSYSARRHSPLSMINRQNVNSLHVAWVRQLPSDPPRLESSPIVRGSTMYVTALPADVYALDVATGRELWHFSHALASPLALCCEGNRGVAILGDRVFFGTMDAHLIALDAGTGKLLWDHTIAESGKGYTFTAAPLVIGDMIVIGSGGGDLASRQFLDAYDARTGAQRWRFYTIPASGETGNETWSGNSWRTGGGGPWMTGAYDPDLGLLYWGVGNPNPDLYGGSRLGDNLYTNSVVAINASTGKLVWYFQFSPHDTHDWDSAQVPVLVDGSAAYPHRKLLAWANRNGFYYLLDRQTGEFLTGQAFIRQNWSDGLDEKGRSRARPGSIPTPQGILIYPQSSGATSWWSPSYDSDSQLLYIPTIDTGSLLTASQQSDPPIGEQRIGSGLGTPVVGFGGVVAAVRALDVSTGKLRWQYDRPTRSDTPQTGGVLSTAGGLVFGGDLDTFFALDAKTGAELWQFHPGGKVASAPVTFEHDGRQYVIMTGGTAVFAFTLQ